MQNELSIVESLSDITKEILELVKLNILQLLRIIYFIAGKFKIAVNAKNACFIYVL